jgi:hypothetical protein
VQERAAGTPDARRDTARPKEWPGMSYRNLLIDRFRRETDESSEPRVLDYLQHRNDDALRAWRQRQFEYERGRVAYDERRAS